MMPTPRLHTQCHGQYFVNRGEHSYVQFVTGYVIEASQKCLAEGMGIAYMQSKVIVETADGPRTAYILQGCQKVLADGRPVALMGSPVGNCTNLLWCQLTSNYSQRVLTS